MNEDFEKTGNDLTIENMNLFVEIKVDTWQNIPTSRVHQHKGSSDEIRIAPRIHQKEVKSPQHNGATNVEDEVLLAFANGIQYTGKHEHLYDIEHQNDSEIGS